MTPQPEYGYLYNPSDWQEGDEWEPEPGHWIKERKEIFDHGYPRRRLIKPGDGYRILGLDESLPQAFEALFAQLPEKWIAMRPAHVKTVKEALAFHSGIRAIRVPLEKEKIIEQLAEEGMERMGFKKGGDENAIRSRPLPTATKAPKVTKGAKESMKAKSNYRDPLPEELTTPEFEAVWKEIKRWDINVPDQYAGYCGATGNHVMAILNALKPVLAMLAQSQQPKFCGEWTRTKQGESVEYEVEYFSDGKGYDWKLQYFPKPPAPIVEKKEEFDLWWMDNHTTDVDSITARELAYMAWHAALQSKGVSSCCSDKKA